MRAHHMNIRSKLITLLNMTPTACANTIATSNIRIAKKSLAKIKDGASNLATAAKLTTSDIAYATKGVAAQGVKTTKQIALRINANAHKAVANVKQWARGKRYQTRGQ